MLVDSGTDYSMLSQNLMSLFGLCMEDCDTYPDRDTSGGHIRIWVPKKRTLTYRLLDKRLEDGGHPVSEAKGPLVFFDGLVLTPGLCGLLGVVGFFDHFKVRIEAAQKKLFVRLPDD